MLLHSSNAVRNSRKPSSTTTTTSGGGFTVLKRMFFTVHFVVLAFLWDGSLDLVCPTAYAQMRGSATTTTTKTATDLDNQAARINMGNGAISQTLKPSYLEDMKHDLFPGEKPTHAQPTDLSPKNAAHKDAMPGRSSDAGARHSELLHHLEKHTASKTMKAFHQSYSAGPPPSPFWNVLKGAKTKMSDLRPDPQELANRPLLSVVMILKNEEQSIAGMIESMLGVVDRYTIIDTGSTDRTKGKNTPLLSLLTGGHPTPRACSHSPFFASVLVACFPLFLSEIIRESFGDTPGDIYDEEFTDFATTRNRVIELEGTKSVFTLMLSGDEYLRDGMALRRFCEKHRDWDAWVNRGAAEEAYNLRILYGSDVYDSTRLHRTDARWFYVGVTHEYMTNAKKRVAIKRAVDDKGMIPKIFHDLSTSDPKKKKVRWSIDRDLLLEEWAKNPNRTRTAFYLAQSYECLHDYPNAFKWYRTRWNLKGWNEEAYEARFRMARVSRHLGKTYSWPDTQQMYLSAHAYLPKRIEPLYAIGHYYYHEQWPRNYQLAFLFLHRASMIPFPSTLRLFLDKVVYDFKVGGGSGVVGWAVVVGQ